MLSGGQIYDDRAAAIMYAAMLERSLELALMSRFVSDQEMKNMVFSYQNDGPLSTYNSKVLIGYAIGLYGKEMMKDMKLILSIRNAFAHAQVHVDFNTDAIVIACSAMVAADWSHDGKKIGSRARYLAAVGFFNQIFLSYHESKPLESIQKLYQLHYDSPLPLPRKFG